MSLKITEKDTNTNFYFHLPTPALYQAENLSLSFLVSRKYCQKNQIRFNSDAVKESLLKNSWPGRLQVLQTNPTIIFDVSHNYQGIEKTLISIFRYLNPAKTDLLIGIVNDKDVNSITRLLSGKFRRIIVTEPDSYRKQSGAALMEAFKQNNEKTEFIKDLKTAFEQSKKNLKSDDTLIALGSHYLIGPLITY